MTTRAALLVAVLAASTARAQTTAASTGIAAERFVPALGPTALVGVDGAAVTPAGSLSFAASLDVAHDQISLRVPSGELFARPVRDLIAGDVALEFGVWRRLEIGRASCRERV